MGFHPAFAINTNISSNENNTSNNDLIEVTFRICKFNEIIENTAWLTQEESHELDEIIDNVKEDLENAGDIDEEKEVYNNAIISFNKLGLLPENIKCGELQKLVSNNIYHKIGNKIKLGSNNNYKSDVFRNWFCSITGESNQTIIFPHISLVLYQIGWIIFEWLLKWAYLDEYLAILILLIMTMFIERGDTYLESKDRSFFGTKISFGMGLDKPFNKYPHLPATGWIVTRGLNGYKSFEGLYFGQLNNYTSLRGDGGLVSDYIGVTGFTGIQINKGTRVYYMGDALRAHIGTEPLL
jgi:hypothetical protein